MIDITYENYEHDIALFNGQLAIDTACGNGVAEYRYGWSGWLDGDAFGWGDIISHTYRGEGCSPLIDFVEG